MAISTQLQQLLRVLLPDKGFKTAGSHRDAIIAGVEESKTYTDEKAAEAVKKTGNETIAGVKTFSDGIIGDVTGNASTVTNGVYNTGNQTIGGVKTFTSAPVLPDATDAQHPVTKGVFDSFKNSDSIAISRSASIVTTRNTPCLLNTSTKTLTIPASYLTSPFISTYKTIQSTVLDLSSVWGVMYYIYYDLEDETIKTMIYTSAKSERLNLNHLILATGYASYLYVANFSYLIDGIAPLKDGSLKIEQLNFTPLTLTDKINLRLSENSGHNIRLMSIPSTHAYAWMNEAFVEVKLSGTKVSGSTYHIAQMTKTASSISIDFYRRITGWISNGRPPRN